MSKTHLCTLSALAALIFSGGLAAGLAIAEGKAGALADPAAKVTFENARVIVREITLPPGGKRPARTRETDELVLFYAESHYQAIDDAGKKAPRDRAAGTVVWHQKGERAPTLVNPGTRPVHYYSVALK